MPKNYEAPNPIQRSQIKRYKFEIPFFDMKSKEVDNKEMAIPQIE
jgi:hypothetical protein